MATAKLNTGYVRTVMEGRGIRFHSADRTRSLIASLPEEDRVFIATCLRKVHAGVEESNEFAAVAAIGYCTSDEVHTKLASSGLTEVPLVSLYKWVVSDADGLRRIKAAADGDESERRAIAERLGLDQPGVRATGEHAVNAALAEEVHWQAPEAEMGGAGKPRKRSRSDGDWAGQDKARSYARDEPQVKAAAAGKHHVYVKSAGLTFEIDKLRRGEEGRRFTVRVEGAQGSEGKGYDWLQKVTVQLTAGELHQAAAVVLGMADRFVASHHGDQRDKGLEIRREKGGVMVRLTRTGQAIAVGVGQDHLYKVALVFMRALTMNDPDVDPRVLLDTLRLTAAVDRAAEK